MLQAKQEKSLGELFSDLSQGLSNLMRQEVQLAKTEITQKVASAGKNIGFLVAAGVLAFVGFEALIAAAIIALALVLAPWLAAVIVGLALMIVSGILAFVGISSFKKTNMAPQETIETLKEDAQWAKAQMR
ncbi:MAG: phage holin family protein [Abitibacteriaceae bacterium]|nr:phage holin family protein [Abditibacteriaceae bacterium]MBV9868608.1 phage holin family protein [Abditibacteriaceae bacterium]